MDILEKLSNNNNQNKQLSKPQTDLDDFFFTLTCRDKLVFMHRFYLLVYCNLYLCIDFIY